MYPRIALSLIFISTVLSLLAWAIPSPHYFGLNEGETLLKLGSYLLTDPLRIYGATFLTSFFLHQGIQHHLVNSILLIMLSTSLEKQIGKLWYLTVVFLPHILSLTFLSFFFNQSVYLSGASVSVLSLLSYQLISENKKNFLSLVFLILLLYSFYSDFQIADISHLLGFSMGIILYFSRRLRNDLY